VLEAVKEVSKQIETAFSLDLITRVGVDGDTPVIAIACEAGLVQRPNAKTNVGLGRPLFKEE
jgi:hypothetical protein